MLGKSIQKIKDWMIDNQTCPELITWVPKYLGHQVICHKQ